jgi:hypothetical protein
VVEASLYSSLCLCADNMGCGAPFTRSPDNSENTPNDTERQTTPKRRASKGLIYFYFFSFFFK